jgi:hypothetical protein
MGKTHRITPELVKDKTVLPLLMAARVSNKLCLC